MSSPRRWVRAVQWIEKQPDYVVREGMYGTESSENKISIIELKKKFEEWKKGDIHAKADSNLSKG